MTVPERKHRGVSAEVAGHLAIAIALYRRQCADRGISVPMELAEIERQLSTAAIDGQTWPKLEKLSARRDHEHMEPRLLSFAQAGEYLGCSARTVRRRAADGLLKSTRNGGLVRFRTEDLDSFLATAQKG